MEQANKELFQTTAWVLILVLSAILASDFKFNVRISSKPNIQQTIEPPD
jgi:hypothetical protein